MNRVKFIILFSIFSGTVNAQTEPDMIRYLNPIKGIGAQSLGMGYSNSLISTDNSSLFLNPAAVGMINKTTINVNLNYNGGTVKSNWLNTLTDQDFSNTKINQLSAIYPYDVAKGSFVLAFGYGQYDNFDQTVKGGGFNETSSFVEGLYGYDPRDRINKSDMKTYIANRRETDLLYDFGFDAFLLDTVYTGSNPNIGRVRSIVSGNVQQDYKSISEGGMNTWSFALSAEIIEGVYAGASVHFINGDYYNQYYYTETGVGDYYKNMPDSGIYDPYDKVKRYFGSFYMKDVLEEKITGYSAKFGLVGKFLDVFRGGVSYSLPTSLSVDTKNFVDLESQLINFESSVDVARWGTSKPLNSSGSYELTGASNIEANFAYMGFPFSSEVGFSTQDWPNTRIESSDKTENYDDLNDFFRFNTKRTWDVKAGVQYAVPDIQSFIRVGIYSQDSPYKQNGERVNRYSLGYEFVSASGFSINVGYQIVNSSETYKAYNPIYKPKVNYTEDQTYSSFSSSFVFKF